MLNEFNVDAKGDNEVSDSEIGTGNSKSVPIHQLKHWCFTWNNYHIDTEKRNVRRHNIAMLERCLGELCYMYCFQEEEGEINHTPHLQGVISLHKRARWSEFGLPKDIHWEKCKHVPAAYEYCSKEYTRTGEIFVKNFALPPKIPCIWKDWQFDIDQICQTIPDDRKVYWYWSSEGKTGKSTMVKYLMLKYKAALIVSGKYSDICNLLFKTDTKIVCFDLPRNNGNQISYSAIESIKNGMISNTKYETGFKVFDPPHVFIFANAPPDLKMLSADRWVVINIGDILYDLDDADLTIPKREEEMGWECS